MRILVTGGAGFIGSHTVRALLDLGHDVVVLDNLTTGKMENLPQSMKLDIILGDIADESAVEAALQGCEAFVHLAAIASVDLSVQEPLRTHRTNLFGSIQLFECAARMGVRRALYASSAAIYGPALDLPLSEASRPQPLTPYAIDKLAGEYYLAHYHRTKALEATTFRFFNVFGPRQDPTSPYSGVVSIFLDKVRTGEQITIFGDGQQSRDFVYVGDVVGALLASLEAPVSSDEMPIYNVARGVGVQLTELLEVVKSLPGRESPLPVKHEPARVGDIRHSVGDSSKLRRELGWNPKTSIREGMIAILHEGSSVDKI